MFYFLLAVGFTVSLYLIMRAFPRHNISTFQAVAFNYYACVITGFLLMPDRSAFSSVEWTSTSTLLTVALGAMFVLVFVLIGQAATKSGVMAASLASNMSLIIPVLFGLFIFKNNNKLFDFWNYAGILLALAALVLSVLKKEGNKTTAQTKWLFPVLLFLCSGTNNTLINFLSSKFYRPDQTPLFMIIACIGAIVVGTSLLCYRLVVGTEKIEVKNIVGGVVLGVPNFLSLYFLLKALTAFGNSAAYVFPIYNVLTILVSSIMGWVLFKEKLQPLNRLGLLIAVMAIVLISHQELGL